MSIVQGIRDKRCFAPLFFAGLAAVLFHPLFLGKFALGGTDVLFNHYPNILFGHREFAEFGALSLWSRYIFSGFDFTGSIHAHYLNPLYWPLLFFPEKYIFHVMTAAFMAMNGLTGWFWSRIAAQLGTTGTDSLIVGVVAQAGMFFWFAMTTMIGVPMYLCASIAIYLILTHESRSTLANYVSLSTVLSFIFITPHPTYILGFFLPVFTFYLLHNYPNSIVKPWQGLAPIFFGACVTAILLTAYRLVPVGIEIITKGAALTEFQFSNESVNSAYFGLTMFNPLSFGINIGDALLLGQALHLEGRHTQIHSALYFGIVPLVFAYIALRAGSNIRIKLLAVSYIVFQCSYLYALQPLSDIIYLIMSPFGHEGLFRPVTAIIFLFLLIESLKAFSNVAKPTLQRVVRECALIAGLLIATWVVMYTKILIGVPEVINRIGVGGTANVARFTIVVVLVGTAFISFFSHTTFARLRFGLLGILIGALIVIIGNAVAAIGGLLPGPKMVMNVFKTELAILFACLAILLAQPGSSKLTRKIILFCGSLALLIFFMPIKTGQGLSGLSLSAWASTIGWGVFVALLVVALNILARFSRNEINISLLSNLFLALVVIDLVTAYVNYSYVNIWTSPFIRRLTDIYPSETLPVRFSDYKTDLADQSGRRNYLANPEFHMSPPNHDQLADWVFGGKEMALCPRQRSDSVQFDPGNIIFICYPYDDGGGNLYQDVPLEDGVSEVAMGVWLLAEQGMEYGVFLTNPTNNTSSRLAKHKGDGKWHWVQATVQAGSSLKVVRPHINLAKAGYVYIYAPRLISGSVVMPIVPPDDGREVAGLKADFPNEVDLASFRVNHAHIINQYSGNEMMTNFALVARTPTYAGVDSDLSADYAKLLHTFKSPDPSWYHRAGLVSTLEDTRLLDLLGVGYDTAAEGGVSFRPNAIPRFAAFSRFEVQSDPTLALQRLKAADFDPTKIVLLQGEPTSARPNSDFGRFRLLRYETPEADQIRLRISETTPRLILFNDRFSPGWQASWNGKPIQIERANFAFMAVVLPEGAGELNFEFRPRLFILLAKVSAAIAAILSLLAIFTLYRSQFWKTKCRLIFRRAT